MHFTLSRSTNFGAPGTVVADLPHGHGAATKPAAALVPKSLLSVLPFPGSHVGLAQAWKAPLLLQDSCISEAEDLKPVRDRHTSRGHGLQSALLPSCLRVMGSSLPCSPPVYQCPSHWLWPPHPISKTRGWQTMACRTNPAPLLFFYIKFYWNIAMPICSWIVKGCFCAILAELSSCYKDQISCKGWNIYYLAEKVSQTLVKTIAMHRLLNQLPQWWKVESLNICAQI